MRGLTNRMREAEPQTAAALGVIQVFDDMVARGVSLHEAVAVAEELSGLVLTVRDELNDRTFRLTETASQPPRDVPAYGAQAVAGGSAAAPVAVADGRVGVVWSDPRETPYSELELLVLERLAVLVAVDARRLSEAASPPSAPAVERLLTTRLAVDEAGALARELGLPATGRVVPVAVCAEPSVALEAVAAVLSRGLGKEAVAVVPVDRVIALITRSDPVARLEEIRAAQPAVGWGLEAVVARTAAPHELADAWREACAGLTVGTHLGAVRRADDLGLLPLLDRLPTEVVLAAPDVKAVARIAAGRDGSLDLALLTAYCESGSLRATAEAVHLHHSSVDYRLKKLTDELGYRLDSADRRLRLLLALRCWQLHRQRGAPV